MILLGDPTRALGSLAEPECRRIIAALDLAEELGVPLEWFAALRRRQDRDGQRHREHGLDRRRPAADRRCSPRPAARSTSSSTGINVGAQPYWNAEATMLMHTRGILVMTPESAMVLTGKQALDYSGGVSAEDNFGIGGYERIMGPNGQAQYWAPDVAGACRVLLAHYEHSLRRARRALPAARRDRRPGRARRRPRRAPTRPAPTSRASATSSPTRPTPGARSRSTSARSCAPRSIATTRRSSAGPACTRPRSRWSGTRTSAAGRSRCSGSSRARCRATARSRPTGPSSGRQGTLFPRASKKIARAINAASGRRPVVVLANLAGFDGSPESMREWQLEFGAEIGRAVVNFDGPIVFCVVSRYHGGAFVVFSQKLNPNLEAAALEGAHASVIGGAPAAAVVFARDVEQAARRDERIVDARRAHRRRRGRRAPAAARAARRRCGASVLAEKRGEFAAKFDAAHSVERAVRMGSVSRIVAPASLRPYLIDAVERGMRRALDGAA